MTTLGRGHGGLHAYATREGDRHGRTAGKGKPRHNAPDMARRTDEPDARQPGPVAQDSGRGEDGGGAREALRPLVEHPKVDSDLKKLPKGIQQTYHERVDELRRGNAHPSTHTLGGPFKGSGWQATRLNFQYRMVHKHIGDELHVLSAGNHDETYEMGQRRMGKTDLWPPYLKEREDEEGGYTHPVNESRSNPRGPVGTEEDAKAAGWAGPFYHGTSKRRAQDIRRGGFRQPRLHNWEMKNYGDVEEVDNGHTHRTFFTDDHDLALDFARSHHGDDADVVTAYLHPHHHTTDEGGGFMPSTQVKDVAHAMAIRPHRTRKTAAVRMVPPEELGNFHYPDYPKAKTPAALAKHFKKTSPEYFEKVKADVAKNGFSTPALARFNDPRGRPLKKPVFMEGHHRAAVAHELGVHLPVGDYDDNDDFDASRRSGAEWFSKHERPTDDMPKQAAHWMPTKRLFGPTYGLDHRLFDEKHELRPDVRKYILETLNSFWKPRYGLNWDQWARVYFAGSEASEWTSPALEGNNDFDILIGVDYDAYRANGSRKFDAHKTDLQITDELNDGFRKGLNPRTANAMIMVDGVLTGPWDNTWYVNPHSYDIRDIRPYAAYDVTDNRWAVKPPHLPDWNTNAFPEGKGLSREIRGILDMAKGILAMPEPYRTQNGRALWEFVHSNRSDAFGPQGEGWYDPRNVIEKALDQAGLMQQLWALMDNARRNPHLLDAPAGWSNDPGR